MNDIRYTGYHDIRYTSAFEIFPAATHKDRRMGACGAAQRKGQSVWRSAKERTKAKGKGYRAEALRYIQILAPDGLGPAVKVYSRHANQSIKKVTGSPDDNARK